MVLKQFLVILIIIAIAILLLGVRVFFTKRGFPNIHIGSNKAMRKRGIGCYTSQDRDAQKKQ
jgi:hypothetical protein